MMKSRTEFSFQAIAICILLSACIRLSPSVVPSQTPLPTSLTNTSPIHKVGDFQVKVDVSNPTVRSNEIITFTIEITGTACGNPTYFIDIKDRTPSQSKYRATVRPSGEIIHEYGESRVLELSSVPTVSHQPVVIILKAQNAGTAEIAAAVNGEIGYTDGKNNFWFNYETRFSEPFMVTVSEK